MTSFIPTVEGGIRGFRFRYGLFGRPVVQIRRDLFRLRFYSEGPNAEREPWGSTAWRDATRHDLPELTQLLSEVGRIKDVKPFGTFERSQEEK